MDDDAILALVTRLARPQPSGGAVIERAAILAEGADFPAVMAWITAHAGKPETTVLVAPSAAYTARGSTTAAGQNLGHRSASCCQLAR